MNVLVISGHNDLQHSVANATVINEIERQLPDAEVRRLDALYGNGPIDVAAEQEALRRADVIVWQFPMYWYSLPALMKRWLDEVFLHGFAYGSTAVLGGKKFLVSLTTGAPAEAYTGGEGAMTDIGKLTEMYGAIARLCNLDYLGAIWANGMITTGQETEAQNEEKRQRALDLAARVVAKVRAL